MLTSRNRCTEKGNMNYQLQASRQKNWTYLIFCFVASATFVRWIRMYWCTFANDFRQLICIGIPRLRFFINHCRNGDTPWAGWWCDPHKLNFTLLVLVGLFQCVHTIDVKFGHGVVEQLETSNASWIHCCVSASISICMRYGTRINSEIRKLFGVFAVCTWCH